MSAPMPPEERQVADTAAPKICRHCGREIVPTEFGTWQDKDNLGYEVCDLMDDAGSDHEPLIDGSQEGRTDG